MRVMLARLLLQRPSLLLLDEPTNHLDIESLEWLESFLADYEGTVVLVSHDRYFLNRMVTSIAELAPSGLTVYPGDYDGYLLQRQARRELLEAQARNQAKRIAEIERFIERFRYKASKARQVQSRVKMLDRIDRIQVEREARVIHFAFPQPPRTGRRVATLKGIHKAYGDNVVYAGVDFEVERGARAALVGPNGAGKSTLLKMLAGTLPFDRGERTLGAHVAVHYYAQHQLDALTPSLTVLEELERAAPELGQTRLRTILGTFLFSGDAVEKKIAVRSAGGPTGAGRSGAAPGIAQARRASREGRAGAAPASRGRGAPDPRARGSAGRDRRTARGSGVLRRRRARARGGRRAQERRGAGDVAHARMGAAVHRARRP